MPLMLTSFFRHQSADWLAPEKLVSKAASASRQRFRQGSNWGAARSVRVGLSGCRWLLKVSSMSSQLQCFIDAKTGLQQALSLSYGQPHQGPASTKT
jgi:hypothetical protein